MPGISIPHDRTELASLPTPVNRLERTSERHDAELYAKRDDRTAGVAHGNKVRKLEYVLQDALDEGADAVVTGGGVQSNHCRATAVLAREVGLTPHLLLSGEPEGEYDGNHLLSNLVDARIRYLDADIFGIEAEMRKTADRLREAGKRPYVVPVGASNPLGTLGYVRAYDEIRTFQRRNDLEFDTIFVPAGSMGTYAGLLAGALLTGGDVSVVGVKVVERDAAEMRETAVRLVDGVADLLGQSVPNAVTVEERVEVLEGYLGDGYGIPSEDDLEAIGDAGRREGLVLDPTYTGKAFRAFLAESEPGETGLFVHTGGSYGIFPKRGALTRALSDDR